MTRCPCRAPAAAAGLLLAAFLLLLSACGGSPPVYVHQYMLSYPPPSPAAPPPLPAVLKVERFESMPLMNTQRMLIVSGPQEMTHYQYHRWRGYPADMVSGLLARDLLASRRYTAVFGPASTQMPRFRLEGGVLQFVEQNQGGGVSARLQIEAALMDYHQRGALKRVVFQKSYAKSVPMGSSQAADLARALSRAMAQIAPQVLADIEAAVAARLAQPDPEASPAAK
jgi:ABC-type uncharacterized transport system auxiliary subunit